MTNIISYEGKAQQFFDDVVAHLRSQNCKALSKTGACRYRGENSTKCAIGGILPDELYFPALEGIGICSMYEGRSKERWSQIEKIVNFIGIWILSTNVNVWWSRPFRLARRR